MSSRIYLLIVSSLLVFYQLHLSVAAPGTDDPDPPRRTSTVELRNLTAEAYRSLISTGRLSVVEAGTGVLTPGDVKAPCGQTWSSWWAQNYWYFQCIANMNCEPYWGCWCNWCACYAFIVYPQSPPCRVWNLLDVTASSKRVDGYFYSTGTRTK